MLSCCSSFLSCGSLFPRCRSFVPFLPRVARNGWLVVFGAWSALGTVYGFVNSAAVFQYYFSTHQLAGYNELEISWVFSIHIYSSSFSSASPPGVSLTAAMHVPWVILGTFCLSLSFLLLSTYSCLGGLGGAFLSCPAFWLYCTPLRTPPEPSHRHCYDSARYSWYHHSQTPKHLA